MACIGNVFIPDYRKDVQYLAANVEGPNLGQGVKSILSILTYSISVSLPLQSVVQVSTEVSISPTLPLLPG